MGWVCRIRLIRYYSWHLHVNFVQISLTIGGAYATFLFAETVLGVSGILACLAASFL